MSKEFEEAKGIILKLKEDKQIRLAQSQMKQEESRAFKSAHEEWFEWANNEGFKSIKPKVVDLLQYTNEQLFEGEGVVSDWEKVWSMSHEHDESMYSDRTYRHRVSNLQTRLKTPIGNVIVFVPLSAQDRVMRTRVYKEGLIFKQTKRRTEWVWLDEHVRILNSYLNMTTDNPLDICFEETDYSSVTIEYDETETLDKLREGIIGLAVGLHK